MARPTRPASRSATSSSPFAGEGVRTQAEFYRKVWGGGAAGSEVPLRVLQGIDVKELQLQLHRPRRLLPSEHHALSPAP